MLWEKFQWILPLYMKPINFQSKASVVWSVTAALFIDFCLKKLNVFSQHTGKKNKWISEFHRTNPQELKCWSTFYVNYFLRYYLMMQHQPVVKRVNGTHEWAHRHYQPLSAPYHCCLYKGLGLGLQVLYSVTNCTGNILGRFTNITSNRTRLQCSRYKQYTH